MKPGFPSTQSSQGALLFSTLLPVNRTSFPTVQENALAIPALSASERSGPLTARPSADDRRVMLLELSHSFFSWHSSSLEDVSSVASGRPLLNQPRRVTQSLVDPSSLLRDNVPTMTPKLTDKKLAVLGTGKLGGILLRAYLKQELFSPRRVSST